MNEVIFYPCDVRRQLNERGSKLKESEYFCDRKVPLACGGCQHALDLILYMSRLRAKAGEPVSIMTNENEPNILISKFSTITIVINQGSVGVISEK